MSDVLVDQEDKECVVAVPHVVSTEVTGNRIITLGSSKSPESPLSLLSHPQWGEEETFCCCWMGVKSKFPTYSPLTPERRNILLPSQDKYPNSYPI